jgi:hypothetical protein
MYTDPRMYDRLKLLFEGGFMAKFINRVGQRFGKLRVLARAGTNELKKVLWRCACDCGKTFVTTSGALVTGNTRSCGCIVKNFKHGGSGKASYNTWRAMLRRCTNPKDKDYPRYGGAGVSVCPEWMTYATFAADMGEPEGTQTLDRVNTYGNYSKENCRWATATVQNRNVRVRKLSKTGHIGVRFRNNAWYAEITAKGVKYYAKVAHSLEEAVQNRAALERLHWGNS